MNISIVGVGMYPHEVGGAQTNAFHVANGLAQRGHEVTALVFHRAHGQVVTHEDRADGFRRIRVGIPDELWRSPLSRELAPIRAWLADVAAAALQRRPPDLVHFFRHSPVQSLVLDLVEAAAVPGVFTALGFAYFCARGPLVSTPGTTCDGRIDTHRCEACMFLRGRQGHGLQPFAALAMRALDTVAPTWKACQPQLQVARRTAQSWSRMTRMHLTAIAPSQVVERTFRANGFPADRIERLTYGIPESVIAQRRPKSAATRPRFTYLGKISEYKGTLVAVEAARLAAAQGARFELRIFGPVHADREPYHRDLAAAVEAVPWPGGVTVRLCGRYQQDQLAEIHADTDAMVFTSLWPENATIVVLEALALGTPVLASDVEGVTEFIRDGENGWIYPRGDAAALAARMTELCRSPAALRTAQAGTRCVLTAAQMIDGLEAVYARTASS